MVTVQSLRMLCIRSVQIVVFFFYLFWACKLWLNGTLSDIVTLPNRLYQSDACHVTPTPHLELGKSLGQGFHCFKICGLIKYLEIGSQHGYQCKWPLLLSHTQIKTTVPLRYKVRPNLALINPKSVAKIHVLLVPGETQWLNSTNLSLSVYFTSTFTVTVCVCRLWKHEHFSGQVSCAVIQFWPHGDHAYSESLDLLLEITSRCRNTGQSTVSSFKLKCSVPFYFLQLWEKNLEAVRQTWDRKPGFEIS